KAVSAVASPRRLKAPAFANLSCIDLFCGAGGLSHGFQQAGFRVLAGQDYDQAAGHTFVRTHRDAGFIGGPIQDVTAKRLLRVAGLLPGELDVLVGGPPCQGYSVYNHNRGESDPRAHLFREYLRLVEGLKPKWIVMENVTGLTSVANGKMLREILVGIG